MNPHIFCLFDMKLQLRADFRELGRTFFFYANLSNQENGRNFRADFNSSLLASSRNNTKKDSSIYRLFNILQDPGVKIEATMKLHTSYQTYNMINPS